MATSYVKLLGTRSSPYVNRAQIALNIKSVNYEFLEEKMGSKSELLLESNPIHKKIPVLIHDDKPICESLIIVQYIDQVWTSAPSILPSDPYDRAIACFWAAYIDDKLIPLLKEIRTAEGEESKAAAIERVVEGMVVLEEAFVKCSKGKAFFGGDSIGYVDIAFGCLLGWLKVTQKMGDMQLFTEARTPNLVIWAERFCSHDAVKDVIPKTEELLEISKIKILQAREKSP
ncbi:hypothetical protein F0562_032849 [Nyssa sinensis]|uniref:glutathione transferase n=1 Tax=Nyssa sinensis TaxID=561372 RepID=A0A5J5ARZ9_9ASTE|nr:hypothetical protein F0562_032849 [Nyssa sinensis]